MKLRQNIYLDSDVIDTLDEISRRENGNKSHMVNAAVRDWLDRRAAGNVHSLLKPRLDRMSREIGKVRRDVGFMLEALMLFVRYELTVLPPLNDADQTALIAGQQRYDRFIAQVGRHVAAGGFQTSSNDDEVEARS
ncbi:MAG: ribbon-helix-helix protein, CopG family [Oxalobacteraceae bacterium]|nr:MAG: ribbon-helix-helix protein, CopG family [Oxalobacteraceae bacterium]